MAHSISRRELLAAAGGALLAPCRAASAPTAPVAIARCRGYGAELTPALDKLFDQLGGLGRLVKGKTVAVKVNLTGSPSYRLGYLPPELTHWTHPAVIGATAYLLGRAGARRIRILESPWSTADPLEEVILQAGWDPRLLLNAAANVEFENTNYLGGGKRYVDFPAPHGGHLFPLYRLNHSYMDCDVFVSMPKLKEHATTGITVAMKNCFGITPCTIYGAGAGADAPSDFPRGGRGLLHDGHRQPAGLKENNPNSPREDGYRVPRAVADLVAARPIDLCVVDGIESMAGGEGPWIPGARPVRPGLLLAGTNCVTTDAVATALMGFDPMAGRGQPPFENCDSTLALAEALGAGARDLSRIEIAGAPVSQARFDFRAVPRQGS